MSSSTASAEAAAARFRRPRLRASSLTVVALAAAVVLVTQGALIAHADDLETVPAAAAGEVASGEPAALAEDAAGEPGAESASEVVVEVADEPVGPEAEPIAEPVVETAVEAPVEASEPVVEAVPLGADAPAPAELASPPASLVENLPVVTKDDYFVIGPGATLTLAAPGILGNDSDPENDPFTAQQGAFTTWLGNTGFIGADGQFGFTAAPGFAGTDTIEYFAQDAGHGGTTGTIYVTVQEALDPQNNHWPSTVDDTYSTPQNEALSMPPHLGLLANDTDADGDLITTQALGPVPTGAGGSITIDADGSFYYVPAAGFLGVDYVQYIARDVFGGSSSGSLVIAVTPSGTIPAGPNQAPIAGGDFYTTPETVPITILAPNGLLVNDFDPEGGAVSIMAEVAVSQAGGHAVINADGSFTFTPSGSGGIGDDNFGYTLVDEAGLQTQGYASITITPFVPIVVVDEPGTDPGTTIPMPSLPSEPTVPLTPITPHEPAVTPVGAIASRGDSVESDHSDASGLALTGLSLWQPLGGAVGVLLLGAFGLVAARRRRRSR